MTKQDETHRVMFTLTDQAIAKLNQLVAKKQQEVNQNPDLAKYHGECQECCVKKETSPA
ncbi:plasmid replication protein [Lacticaseibacillus rhamnosus]|uniref:plasmid replication protein n=1 Tax=Lacticaseibacillus rhamnosus TaxID=47715 RepID=UPI001912955B|nr:plasmid replication protein [Lacticaseibacillus rhamnosus]